MILEFRDFFFHLFSPEDILELSLDDKAGDRGHGKGDGPETEDDENGSKNPGCGVGADIVDFTISDCGQGDDGHVQAVQERPFPPAQDFEADRTDNNDQDENGQGEKNSFFALHGRLYTDNSLVKSGFCLIIRNIR